MTDIKPFIDAYAALSIENMGFDDDEIKDELEILESELIRTFGTAVKQLGTMYAFKRDVIELDSVLSRFDDRFSGPLKKIVHEYKNKILGAIKKYHTDPDNNIIDYTVTNDIQRLENFRVNYIRNMSESPELLANFTKLLQIERNKVLNSKIVSDSSFYESMVSYITFVGDLKMIIEQIDITGQHQTRSSSTKAPVNKDIKAKFMKAVNANMLQFVKSLFDLGGLQLIDDTLLFTRDFPTQTNKLLIEYICMYLHELVIELRQEKITFYIRLIEELVEKLNISKESEPVFDFLKLLTTRYIQNDEIVPQTESKAKLLANKILNSHGYIRPEISPNQIVSRIARDTLTKSVLPSILDNLEYLDPEESLPTNYPISEFNKDFDKYNGTLNHLILGSLIRKLNNTLPKKTISTLIQSKLLPFLIAHTTNFFENFKDVYPDMKIPIHHATSSNISGYFIKQRDAGLFFKVYTNYILQLHANKLAKFDSDNGIFLIIDGPNELKSKLEEPVISALNKLREEHEPVIKNFWVDEQQCCIHETLQKQIDNIRESLTNSPENEILIAELVDAQDKRNKLNIVTSDNTNICRECSIVLDRNMILTFDETEQRDDDDDFDVGQYSIQPIPEENNYSVLIKRIIGNNKVTTENVQIGIIVNEISDILEGSKSILKNFVKEYSGLYTGKYSFISPIQLREFVTSELIKMYYVILGNPSAKESTVLELFGGIQEQFDKNSFIKVHRNLILNLFLDTVADVDNRFTRKEIPQDPTNYTGIHHTVRKVDVSKIINGFTDVMTKSIDSTLGSEIDLIESVIGAIDTGKIPYRKINVEIYLDLMRSLVMSNTDLNKAKIVESIGNKLGRIVSVAEIKTVMYKIWFDQYSDIKHKISNIKFIQKLSEIDNITGSPPKKHTELVKPNVIEVRGHLIDYDLFREYRKFIKGSMVSNMTIPINIVDIIFDSPEFRVILDNISSSKDFISERETHLKETLKQLRDIELFYISIKSKIFICPVCKRTFDSESITRNHILKNHSVTANYIPSLHRQLDGRCMYCEDTSGTNQHLLSHLDSQLQKFNGIVINHLESDKLKYNSYLGKIGISSKETDDEYNKAQYFLFFCEARVRGDLSILKHSFNINGICSFCKNTKNGLIDTIKTIGRRRLDEHCKKCNEQLNVIAGSYSLESSASYFLLDKNRIGINEFNYEESWELLRGTSEYPISYAMKVVNTAEEYQRFFNSQLSVNVSTLLETNDLSIRYHEGKIKTKGIYNKQTIPNLCDDYPIITGFLRQRIFNSDEIKSLNNSILELQQSDTDVTKEVIKARREIFKIIGKNVLEEFVDMTKNDITDSFVAKLIIDSGLILRQRDLKSDLMADMSLNLLKNTTKQLTLISTEEKRNYRTQL
jgi:hypothetical protein